MSVHYKFKSAISYDTITFDGLHISVRDLKKAILHQKQIGKNTDFDLQVTNAQTNEEYTDDQTLIPKNTSLIVSRIPLTTQQKKAWERAEQNNQLVLSKQILNLDSHEPDSAKLKGADLLGSNASEEDKINAMMAQSTQEYDPSNFVKIRGGNQYGEVPLNYVCHRCHNPGHWIKNCPNNNTTADPIDIKKATGIPRGFLVPVDGPTVPGAMLTGLGTFAVPSIDQEAYKQSMKPQKKQETEVEKVIIPEDLLCTLCSDLLTDAIMMPCCGTSFCDECIRNALLESEENECPDCHGKEISPETLIPNRYLRNAVNGFKDKTGYSKRIEAAKEKITQSKEPQASIPKINIQPPKEEVIIPVSTQSPPSDPSIEESKDEIYQKIDAVGDPIDKTQHNYSAIGTINNNSHNHSTFKTSQPQVQSQVPPVSVNNNSRPNNTNVYIPVNPFQNMRHTVTKSTENRGQHIARYNSQSLSIPPHPHMRPCLPVGPADISVPPPPFAHPPPSIQSDGYNQMQPIHNPPPPGLDRNNSPANASSDEGMHPPESNRHQMDKFDNQTGPHQPMMRTGYPPGYYPPPPMSNYDPYNMPVDMRSRGYHRGYSRRPTRGQPMGSNYRPDYRNGGNYINNKRTIDDPLAVFQRILRERDSKRRDMRVRHSMSRSRSRSLSRSRSRERSRSLSRSPSRIMNHRTRSISRSPLLRNRSITPRRRSRTRSRSPVRKRKKSLSPVKRLPVKSRRRTRSPSRDVQGRRSRSLSLHRRTRSRSRSLTHRNRMSPSPRFRSRSPSFYSSPARFNNYHREDENFGPKGGNWRGRGTWNNKGISQPYQQSHRFRGQFEGHYEIGVDRSTDYTNNYAQFDPHYAMDPNLVRDWDEIRDKEIREREKEKKEEEDKQKKKSKSQSPVKHHKLEKQRQEHKLSPEKNHKDSDKKDKGKRKKKKDVDLDKKKKKKSREKKEKEDGKKVDEKENKIIEADIKLEIEGANQTNQEPAAPGTSESPLPFESVAVKEEVKIKNFQNVSDGLYGDLDEVAPVDTSWGSLKITEETDTYMKSKEETLGDTVEEKPKEPEVLAELPERSKWEVEEDTNTIDDKFDVEKQKEGNLVDNSESHNDCNQVSVTNEVLKRAENAIFQKTVRTIDISGKKTVVDKSEGIKDKKPDIIRDKKIESEKHLSKEKKPDSVKEKKSEVSKDKKVEYVKEKKIDTSRDKKVDNVKEKKQDIVKDKKHDVSKDSKDKKSDVDKDKRPDVKDKKLENVKDRRTDRERRSNDKLSETKTVPEKSSRRDDYASKHKDKKNLESDTAADSLSIQREARKLGHSIQITIPSDLLDDKKNKDGAKRISAKDRLGDKVEDKDDKHYKSRNEKRKASRSRSPVRVHSTLIVPEPPPRKVRASPKARRDSLKKDRNAKTERTTSSNRPSRRDDEKKSDQQKKTETRRIVRPDEKHHRTVEHKNVSKKEDRLEKKEVKKKEEKREEVVKKLKPKEKETEKKERKNRRLEPDRKVCDDRFDNNDEEEIKKLPKDKESDDSVSSSSSSSSSSDSSPVRSKKRKKTKKRKKKHVKKKRLASSSDSDDSDSSSESDDANSSKHKKKKKKDQRKHKVHKKPLKKKKKTKHR